MLKRVSNYEHADDDLKYVFGMGRDELLKVQLFAEQQATIKRLQAKINKIEEFLKGD